MKVKTKFVIAKQRFSKANWQRCEFNLFLHQRLLVLLLHRQLLGKQYRRSNEMNRFLYLCLETNEFQYDIEIFLEIPSIERAFIDFNLTLFPCGEGLLYAEKKKSVFFHSHLFLTITPKLIIFPKYFISTEFLR